MSESEIPDPRRDNRPPVSEDDSLVRLNTDPETSQSEGVQTLEIVCSTLACNGDLHCALDHVQLPSKQRFHVIRVIRVSDRGEPF
jgi:hypothetical protein